MRKIGRVLVVVVCCFWGLLSSNVWAATLQLHAKQVEKDTISLEVSLDAVEKLAGIKLVMEYDEKLLTYADIVKSAATTALLHVVNDKKPGRLIIVMAGANGVSGKKLKIMDLQFRTKKSNDGKTAVKVTEIQLMSEDLKEIPCPVAALEVHVD